MSITTEEEQDYEVHVWLCGTCIVRVRGQYPGDARDAALSAVLKAKPMVVAKPGQSHPESIEFEDAKVVGIYAQGE